MSSIAYVTDKYMIEFHRLNGHHTINFWKPSSSKKIIDFKRGDYLFFLAKGTEKGREKEKGLLGYGKLDKSYTMTFSQMWSKYESLNGYADKESLEEAILKITKHEKLPRYINCFILEEVTFFQAPVYLSEIGLEISNRIESYLYLDKDDMLNTSKILEVANNVGVDLWSNLFQDKKEDIFIKDAQLNVITNISERLHTELYSKYDESRIQKYCANFIHSDNQRMIGKTSFVDIKEDIIHVYLPCMVNANDFLIKLQYTVGHYLIFKGFIEKSEYHKEIDLYILFNQILPEDVKEMLERTSISYKEKLADD